MREAFQVFHFKGFFQKRVSRFMYILYIILCIQSVIFLFALVRSVSIRCVLYLQIYFIKIQFIKTILFVTNLRLKTFNARKVVLWYLFLQKINHHNNFRVLVWDYQLDQSSENYVFLDWGIYLQSINLYKG